MTNVHPRLFFWMLVLKPKWLAWWLAGKESQGLTYDNSPIEGPILAEAETLGYKPFGISEKNLPSKTRNVQAHKYHAALVFSEGFWISSKGLGRIGLKHPSETKTLHGFYVLEARLKRKVRRIHSGVLLYNRWSRNNYYHWMTETLPRIRVWSVRPEAANYPLLIPSSFPDFCLESIKAMAPHLPVFTFSGELELLLVQRLFFISEPWADIPSKNLLRKTIAGLYLNVEFNSKPDFKLVFALRKSGLSRSILNISEVRDALSAIPVHYVDFDDLPFREQFLLMRGARGLVGFHGANLTNLMFLPEGGQVVEISFPFLQASPWNRFCYQHLAQACGLDYTLFLNANTTEESMDGPVWLDGPKLASILASRLQNA